MKNAAIKEHHLYNKAYRRGACSAGKYVVVYVLKDYSAKKLMLAHPEKKYCNRLGLAVTKKLGGAVVRNRVKRILRAAYAEFERAGAVKHGYLVVLNARTAATEAKSTDIVRELRYAFRKTGLLAEADGAVSSSRKAESKTPATESAPAADPKAATDP